MILLTQINMQVRGANSLEVFSEEIISIDPYSVVMIKKYPYNGGQMGAHVWISHVGTITVKDQMVDVHNMVETAIKEDKKSDEDD